MTITDIFEACVCNLERRFLVSFDLFQSAWLILARTAIPDDVYSDLPKEVWDVINFTAICYERMRERAGVPSCGKKSSEPSFQGKWRRWKPFKNLSDGAFTGHLLNMAINQTFSFIGTWTKRKQNSEPFTETNIILRSVTVCVNY